MAFLALNGITIPVAAGSLKVDFDEVGERGRAFSGNSYSVLRAIRRVWSFKTTPMTVRDSDGWRRLLELGGHTWDFEEDLYSAQGGLAITTGSRNDDDSWKGDFSVALAPGNVLDLPGSVTYGFAGRVLRAGAHVPVAAGHA